MSFGLFRSKKQQSAADWRVGFAIHQQVLARLGKAELLQKLGRRDEARQVLVETEQMATSYLRQNPHEKLAHMTVALFYIETEAHERAADIIDRLRKSREFGLTDQERLIWGAELQKLKRERPSEQRSTDDPRAFTQIYCCQKCGRLHNFVSMLCPHCDWSPQSKEETARSIILSNTHFKVPTLLTLCREMAKGRSADDVFPNLVKDGKACLNDPIKRQGVDQIFNLLRENDNKNHRDMNMLRECTNCGTRVLLSDAKQCEKCDEPVTWPDAIRALACMDNLLWLFEQRVEVSPSEAFSEFVCLLVRMANNLLRKQEDPSDAHRKYALDLLKKMVAISDLNRGAIIETTNPRELEIYLVRDSMLEDTATFGPFLYNELKLFVEKMVRGVKM
jgi:rubrerythrin